MKYEFIRDRTDYPVARWAEFLEVSTSGYYDWLGTRDMRAEREKAYRDRVEAIFLESGGTYGADRISGKMRLEGQRSSFRKVKRIMRERGLHSIHLRCQRSLTDSRKARGEGYPNLVRGMTIDEPFQAITSDISYIPTDEGFEYLCTIKDIKSKVILAEMQSDNMSRALVVDTINAARKRWRLPPETVFHSDRGSQYTSEEVMTLIASLGWRQSFSRVGRPGDNAWHESFYSILKKEAVHHARFHTREQARQAVFDFIERFYNRKRIQKSLGYLSPMDALIPRMQLAA